MNVSHLPAPQARAARLGVPYRVHFVLTHKCNLACAHCYQAEHDSEDLDTEQVKRVLAEVAELGVFELVLGGGEPLARRDFWDILEEARRLQFAVTLFTNGTLIDEAKAARLKALGIVKVSLSLHGSEAQTHDAFVRRPGAFDRINRTIDLLEAHGIPVVVKTSTTRTNHREIPKLKEKFAGRRLTTLSVNTWLFPRDDGDKSPLLLHIDEETERQEARGRLERMPLPEFERLLAKGKSMQEAGPREQSPCEAARTTFAIHPNGDVTPCVQSAAQVMGSVRRRPLADIWRDSTVGTKFRSLRQEDFVDANDECATCPFQKVCSRCAAMSFLETGTLTGRTEQLCRSTKIFWTEVRRRCEVLGLTCPV